MRGLAIVLLVAMILWLFKINWLPATFIPAIGIWYAIKTSRRDPVDEVFVGTIFLAVITVGVLALKRIFADV